MLHLNGIPRTPRCASADAADERASAAHPRPGGLVFQNPDDQLFSPTVFEDVAFGPLHLGLPEDEVAGGRRGAGAGGAGRVPRTGCPTT